MFDIFEEKPRPKIYCCDVTIDVKIPVRGKQKKYDLRIFRMHRIPIVMNDGEIATEKQKEALFKKIFDKYIHKGDFDNVIFTIKELNVIEFMSNVSYDFNYLIH